MDCHSF